MTRRSRRAVLELLAVGAAGGLAGCNQFSSGERASPTESPPPEDGTPPRTVTPTATLTSTVAPAPDLGDATRTGQLVAEGGSSNDAFGGEVAVMGNSVLVGADLDDNENGKYAGSVYVFEDVDSEWRQSTKLLLAEGTERASFGTSMSVSGRRVLVGADRADTANGEAAGAAYVFERADGSWTERASLVPEDGDSKEEFGGSVALSEGTALVGTNRKGPDDAVGTRSVYVFERKERRWRQRTELRAAQPDETERFGSAVDLADGTAFVGARNDDTTDGYESGAVYVFDEQDGAWAQREVLGLEDAAWHAGFGTALAVASETLLVGAPGEPKGRGVGAAYVFRRVDGGWEMHARLAAPDGDREDGFGGAVALAGGTALIGASGDGSAYVFERTVDGWQPRVKLAPEDAGRSWFGNPVALGDDMGLVGALADENRNGYKGGAVYVYR